MELEIRLFAGLKCTNEELPCFGQMEFNIDVPEGTTIQILHEKLKLKSTLPLIYLINGQARPKDWMLSEVDRVGIFPPVGGG